MLRSEFLRTTRGQLLALRRRRRRRQYFNFSGLLRSKDSGRPQEAVTFQQNLLAQMRGRRAFRSPVVMQFHFHVDQPNPPSIQSLPKYYLDLVYRRQVSGRTDERNLLLLDDRQVRILVAHYAQQVLKGSSFSLVASPLSAFTEDLSLIELIQHNRLTHDNGSSGFDYRQFEEQSVREKHVDPDDELERLMDWKRERADIVKHHGVEVFDSYYEMQLRSFQEASLRRRSLGTGTIALLLAQDSVHTDRVAQIREATRDLIISPPLSLSLPGVPRRSGESQIFKNHTQGELRKYLLQQRLLSPLLCAIAVTIFLVPPRAQSIDLDNLARLIIPIVSDILKPPSHLGEFRQVESVRKKALPGMLQPGVMAYQVIELPRGTKDGPEGYVRLQFESATHFRGIVDTVSEFLDNWEKAVED